MTGIEALRANERRADGAPRHRRALPMYVGAGGIATASHYATAFVGVQFVGISPIVATTIGFCVGSVVKYWLNYAGAFNSRAPHGRALVRFIVALFTFLLLNTALFWLLQQQFGLHYLLAQAITTVALIPPGYLVHRAWVFR